MIVPQKPKKDNNSKNKTPLEYAFELAKQGFHVFPLPEDKKSPPPTGWQNQSTTDPVKIKVWFKGGRDNIGIDTAKFGKDEGRSLVVVDIDMKNGKAGEQSLAELLGKSILPKTMESITPSGGRHIYFVSDTPYRNSAGKLGEGIDIRASGGYIVAPGSLIDGKPYNGDIRQPATLPTILADMLNKANPTSAVADSSFELRDWFDSKACIEKATIHLRNAAPAIEGDGGDNRTISLANEIGDFGITKGVAYDLMLEKWNSRCIPPWEPEDLKKKVFSAYESRKRQGSPLGIYPPGEGQFNNVSHLISNDNRPDGSSLSAYQELKIYSLQELRDMPPLSFLIDGLLPETGVAFLAGKPGDMKTFLAISLACSVANGVNVGSRKTKQKPVLMMLNEGQAGIYRRINACIDYNGYDETEKNMAVMRQAPDLMQSSSVDQFIKIIEKENIAPGLIILDMFAKATTGGDDNNANAMTKAISNAYRFANRFNALVVLIDHVGKDTSKGIRGSTAKYGGADMIGIVTKNGDIVRMQIMKQKEAEDGFNLQFSINMQETDDQKGGKIKIPVLCPLQGFSPVPKQEDWILGKLEFEGDTYREKLKVDFVKAYSAKRQTFDKVINRLKDDKKIQVDKETGLVSLIE